MTAESPLYQVEDLTDLSELSCPIADNEHLRLSVLRETNLLDSSTQDLDFDRLTSLASVVFNVPICLVSLVDVKRQWFKSSVGLPAPETHRNLAFCSYTVLESSSDVFVVLNSLEDPRFQNNELVKGPPFVLFYAGACLFVEGQKVGSICVIDTKPHKEFSWSEKKMLLSIGSFASDIIKWRRLKHMGSTKHSQVHLSLTHNINTMMTGLNLLVDAILADLKGIPSLSGIEAVAGQVASVDSARQAILLRVSEILEMSRVLPSFCTPFDSVDSVSVYGPQCSMLQVMELMKSIFSQLLPSVSFNVVASSFSSESHECFGDMYLVMAYSALNNVLQSNTASGEVVMRFEEESWSAEQIENDEADKGRVGDVIFSISTTQDKMVDGVTDIQLLSFLDTVLGSQVVVFDPDSRKLEYTLRLPCRLRQRESVCTNDQSDMLGGIEAPGVPLRALVVDDDEKARQALCSMLKGMHCEVVSTDTGKHGLALYSMSRSRNEDFDIIFVDLLLPCMNGFTMLEKMNTDVGPIKSSTIVVALIGLAEQFDDFMQDCRNDPGAYGISFVIVKPLDHWSVQNLLSTVSNTKKRKAEELEVEEDIQSPNNKVRWSLFKGRKIHPAS